MVLILVCQQFGTALGVATSNVAIASSSILKGVDLMKSGFKASQIPPQVHGNTNNGDIMLAMDENCFHILKMSVRYDYAKRIDDYFTKYGYRINELKVPNIHTRQYFNYIQIADDFDLGYGEIPSKYLKVINDTARKGTTIWHNHNSIGDYTVNNINI